MVHKLKFVLQAKLYTLTGSLKEGGQSLIKNRAARSPNGFSNLDRAAIERRSSSDRARSDLHARSLLDCNRAIMTFLNRNADL